MNWFQRHLNWTWFLGTVISAIIIGTATGILSAIVDPYGQSAAGILLYLSMYLLILLIGFFLGWWVLYHKNRTLWWFFILFVPFIGWILFLCIENKSQPPAPSEI